MNNNTGRKRVRRARKNESIKRILLTVCMMAMVAAISIGGTLAWLTDDTEKITNTFTGSDIEITLTETPNNEDGTWSAQVIPGMSYAKDPVVAVEDNTNVDIYLFVECEYDEDMPFDYCLAWDYEGEENAELYAGWEKLESKENVWYRLVKADAETKSWHLIVDDVITVDTNVTKDQVKELDTEISFTAYAIQTINGTDEDGNATEFTAEEAWSALFPS